MTKTLTLLSLLALLIAAGSADARPDGVADSPRGERMKARLEKLKAKLGLNADQIEQIKTIRADQRIATASFRSQLRPLRQQMRSLLQAEGLDEAQITALHQKTHSLKRLLAEQRFRHRLKVMQVLTKEQRIQLVQSFRGKHRRWGRHARIAL